MSTNIHVRLAQKFFRDIALDLVMPDEYRPLRQLPGSREDIFEGIVRMVRDEGASFDQASSMLDQLAQHRPEVDHRVAGLITLMSDVAVDHSHRGSTSAPDAIDLQRLRDSLPNSALLERLRSLADSDIDRWRAELRRRCLELPRRHESAQATASNTLESAIYLTPAKPPENAKIPSGIGCVLPVFLASLAAAKMMLG